MAGRLSLLAGGREPFFTLSLRELELMTGRSGIDIAYLADILARAHALMRSYGLDPADTTPVELYQALGARVAMVADFHNMDDVGLLYPNGQIVSFNHQDIVNNQGRAFGERLIDNMQREIGRGIVKNYAFVTKNLERVSQLVREAGINLDSKPHIVNTFDNKNKEEKVDQQHTTDVPKILCVGDIISDAFIKLNEDHAVHYTDEQGYERVSLELGGKIPYDEVEYVDAVECSPNAAVSMARLGLDARLMSWVGDDQVGKEMVEYLATQNVKTDDFVVEAGMRSNYHYVLRYKADRIKLQKFEDYSYQWHDPADKPDWLYLGVLGEKTWPLHEAILDYLNRNPEIKLVFQPGMYHLMWGAEKMADFYRHAEIVILNREEAAQVTGVERADMHGLFDKMHEMGVTVAVITDGPAGAYASDGKQRLVMPNYPDPAPPLDRTGAGDAFASTITAALTLGKSLEEAMEWAPINSMSVVQQMGAQAGLLSRDELLKHLENAPEDYRPKEFSR